MMKRNLFSLLKWIFSKFLPSNFLPHCHRIQNISVGLYAYNIKQTIVFTFHKILFSLTTIKSDKGNSHAQNMVDLKF